MVIVLVTSAMSISANERNDWYWDSVVNLHIDNHSSLCGKGKSVDELTEILRDIPVDIVQVSAYGAMGTMTTYQTDLLRHPDLGDWDTLAAWSAAARRLDRRFHVYINTRGLKLFSTHPDWMQQDPRGQGSRHRAGHDSCPRPSPDRDGYLETILLPMLREITTTYKPKGFWVDGDHARTQTCYCPHCRKAWLQETGNAEPPVSEDDPDWSRWLTFQQNRYDEYRQLMAETVHEIDPTVMYGSNHSWKKPYGHISKVDPRTPPPCIDFLTCDLSHGKALLITRLYAMSLSPEQSLPHDIMHLCNSKKISLQRVLQQEGLTFASGSPWFLWTSGQSLANDPNAKRIARQCAEFAQARRPALGRSASANPVAVLMSETSWAGERLKGKPGYFDYESPDHLAAALQDAGYGVDIVNEEQLTDRLERCRLIVVGNQRAVSEEALSTLARFTEQGGTVLVTGSGLLADGEDLPKVSGFLGVERTGGTYADTMIQIDSKVFHLSKVNRAKPVGASVCLTDAGGRAILCTRTVGAGQVAYLGLSEVAYPGPADIWPRLLNVLGIGPMVSMQTVAPYPHLVFSMRRKKDQLILHATDITSIVRGRKSDPDTSQIIADGKPVSNLTLRLALPEKPASVQAVPTTTSVAYTWEDGILSLQVDSLLTHAAFMINTPASQIGLLPTSTPIEERCAMLHYPPPYPIVDSFEVASHGHVFDPLTNYGVHTKGATSIDITAERASEGQRSLKFTQASDAPAAFFPFLTLEPKALDHGTCVFSADVWLDPNASCQIEFRERPIRQGHPVGPSVTLQGSGQILDHAGKLLGTTGAQRWATVQIRFDLGGENSTYDLKLTDGKSTLIERKGVPFMNPPFTRCGWIGICSAAKVDAAFYIDNLRLDRLE